MTIEEIKAQKANVRKEIKEKLRGQSLSLRDGKSRRIQEKLVSLDLFISAETVMSYVATSAEVDTNYINTKALETGKKLVVPFIDIDSQKIIASELESIDDLEKGPFGIYVPKDGPQKQVQLKEIDLIVVPALAFDKNNNRLGRGKGYYDRFLADAATFSINTIGLAFQFQVLDTLPSGPQDIPVSMVLTD